MNIPYIITSTTITAVMDGKANYEWLDSFETVVICFEMMMRVELLLHKLLRSLELRPRYLKEPKTLRMLVNTTGKAKGKNS